MAAVFGELARVGHIPKDVPVGKFADAWSAAVGALASQPEMTDATIGISALLSVKDDDEMVCNVVQYSFTLTHSLQKFVRVASSMTSTLMTHHITTRLELILDKETRISHSALAEQVEARLGGGEANKPADMKVWSKGRGLTDVRPHHTLVSGELI